MNLREIVRQEIHDAYPWDHDPLLLFFSSEMDNVYRKRLAREIFACAIKEKLKCYLRHLHHDNRGLEWWVGTYVYRTHKCVDDPTDFWSWMADRELSPEDFGGEDAANAAISIGDGVIYQYAKQYCRAPECRCSCCDEPMVLLHRRGLRR
jgi:hypothetical protein